MACFTCSSRGLSPVFKALSRGAAKYASSKLRSAGLRPTSGEWMARTAVCARCPLYTLHNGTPHCGRPLLQKPARVTSEEGCGCPIAAKAQDPAEHCPVSVGRGPGAGGPCDCKWCSAKRH